MSSAEASAAAGPAALVGGVLRGGSASVLVRLVGSRPRDVLDDGAVPTLAARRWPRFAAAVGPVFRRIGGGSNAVCTPWWGRTPAAMMRPMLPRGMGRVAGSAGAESAPCYSLQPAMGQLQQQGGVGGCRLG